MNNQLSACDVQAQYYIDRVVCAGKKAYDEKVRELMLEKLPFKLESYYVEFIDSMLQDEWIMRGYCTPVLRKGKSTFVYPWEQALLAAGGVMQSSILQGHEKTLGYFLTVIEPCARFALCLPATVQNLMPNASSPQHVPAMREEKQLRAAMLESFLRRLSGYDAALADTISEILTLGRAVQETDKYQVQRLHSVLLNAAVAFDKHWPLKRNERIMAKVMRETERIK